MHMKSWMRAGAVVLGLSTVLIGGGALGAYAQTSNPSSSSSSGSTTPSTGSQSTAPANSGAPANGNCPGM
jgi:hypothetical protein